MSTKTALPMSKILFPLPRISFPLPKKLRFADFGSIMDSVHPETAETNSFRPPSIQGDLLAENLPDMIVRIDRMHRYQYINSVTRDTLGLKPEKVVGKTGRLLSSHFFDAVFPDDMICSVIESGSPEKRKKDFSFPDGIRSLEILMIPETDQDGVVQSVLGIARDVSRSRYWEEKMNALSEMNDIRMREICHRTKNQISSLISLIDLQIADSKNSDLQFQLQDLRDRMNAMMLIQDRLNKTGAFAAFQLDLYLSELAETMFLQMKAKGDNIFLRLDLEPMAVNTETAVNCGLILNELLTNAMKYAFPESRKGEIFIGLHQTSEDKIRLRVKDDGIGLPGNFDIEEQASFGLKFISMLMEQLRGKLTVNGENGAEFVVLF